MPATALVVDDEADVVNLVVHHLQKSGLRTVTAHDGATALDLARRERPGVIVLDLMLPGMTGLEVCRALRRDPTTAGVGIVMLTARGEGGDKVEGFETGADDYVTKPFSPRELVLRVQAVLRRADAAREGAAVIETGDLRLNKGALRGAPRGPATGPDHDRVQAPVRPRGAPRPGAGSRHPAA